MNKQLLVRIGTVGLMARSAGFPILLCLIVEKTCLRQAFLVFMQDQGRRDTRPRSIESNSRDRNSRLCTTTRPMCLL